MNKIKDLEIKATDIRIDLLSMIYNAKAGHTGGALSSADILTVFREEILFPDSSEILIFNTSKPDISSHLPLNLKSISAMLKYSIGSTGPVFSHVSKCKCKLVLFPPIRQ